VPPERQHAPVGCGHGFGAQTVPFPWYVPPAALQLTAVADAHVPSMKQHAPVGCGHGFGVHVVPEPWNDPPAPVQSVDDVTKHDPLAKQHAPVPPLGHETVAQREPAPWNVPPIPAHSDERVKSTQLPPARQHAPTTGPTVGHGHATFITIAPGVEPDQPPGLPTMMR
jgi:hypothetical protein